MGLKNKPFPNRYADTDPSAPSPADGMDSPWDNSHTQRFKYPGEDVNTHSNLPGDALANPFVKLKPSVVRKMYDQEGDTERKKLMWKALKQWARQYSDSLINPYKYEKFFDDIKDDYKLRDAAVAVAEKFAEVNYPAVNQFYYQPDETTQFPSMGDPAWGAGYLNPPVGDSGDLKNVRQLTYPRKHEQNRPESPTWSEGNFTAPYEGKIPQDLDTLEGKSKMSKFFDTFVWAEEDSLDVLFNKKKTASRKKVSKIVKVSELEGFTRVANDLLIHRSTKDLWAMETDEDGNIVISRLFEGDAV